MRRAGLVLVLVLGIFCLQSFAQIGLVVQLPPTANISNVAANANGVVVDAIPGANQFLLSVPAVPKNLSSNDVRWMELNAGSTLPSAPRTKYVTASQTAAP